MLYKAVRERDYSRIQKLAKAGANVNLLTEQGWTPVVRAVVARDRKMVDLLLRFGAKPALGLQAEEGALTFACGRDVDSVAVTKALVEHGVPPDRLIHAAAKVGTLGTVRQLLKRGADPNLQDFLGHRPLREARSPAIIRELFRFGADPLAYSSDNEHPLHFNATSDFHKNIQALLDGGVPPDYPEPGPPDQLEIGEDYALRMAVSLGHYRSARVLLEAGANPDLHSDRSIQTPIMLAARYGHVRLVKLLLRYGASATYSFEGYTVRGEALAGLAQNPEKQSVYEEVLALIDAAERRQDGGRD